MIRKRYRVLITIAFTSMHLYSPLANAVDTAPATAEEWFRLGQQAVKTAQHVRKNKRSARNVILFIGDGMGVSTVTAARILEGQLRGSDGESNRLNFESLPYLAHSVTASANQQTSDSAPTATAIVTGIKANDGAISVDQTLPRNEASANSVAAKSVKTILEQAEDRGLRTGIVTTARVTHATPAVNYAHIGNRDWENNTQLPLFATVRDIAVQLIEFQHGNGVDVVLGGGRSNFMTTKAADPEYPTRYGSRTDGRELIQEWLTKAHATYVWNKSGFDGIDVHTTEHLLGLFERSHMKYEADRGNDTAGEPSLAEMTRKAIEILQQGKNGYYLMVEAGRIDHAHHAGNAYRALTDTIAFSEAVKVARDMTDASDTLLIVTADHSHVFTLAGYPSRGNPILGKAAIDGVELKDNLGLPYTTLGYHNGPGFTGNHTRLVFDPGEEQPVPAKYAGSLPRPDLSEIDTSDRNYMQEAAVPLTSETHGGEDVGIYASGPQSYLFHGTLEQHVIYHVMAKALAFDGASGGKHRD